MGKEIEHKYLVVSESYKKDATYSKHIIQGYLSKDPERVVRIRITDGKAFITVKGKTKDSSRQEFEYQIPYLDATEMISLCIGTIIEKTRWIVIHEGERWEVDEFQSPNFPTVAEIELPSPTHNYSLPSFVGQNVTGNPAYYNSNIG